MAFASASKGRVLDDRRKQDHLLLSHVHLEFRAEIAEDFRQPRQGLPVALIVDPIDFLKAHAQRRQLAVQIGMMRADDVIDQVLRAATYSSRVYRRGDAFSASSNSLRTAAAS